jgi:hypothetical protein
MIYGYNSELNGATFEKSIENYSKGFSELLKDIRYTKQVSNASASLFFWNNCLTLRISFEKDP